MVKCKAITASGKRCKRDAPKRRKYCWQHSKGSKSNSKNKTTKRKTRRKTKTKRVGRGGWTRGWKAAAPKPGKQRRKLKQQCGNDCFLMPAQQKFPICRKCKGRKCSCKPDCRGLLSAKIRARQYNYSKIAKRAQSLGRKNKCGWAK